MSRDLPEGDYILTDGAAWVALKGFALRILSTDEGVVVDIYANGREMDSPIASTYAFDDEITEEDAA